MEPFTIHTGVIAPLNRANIDTDAIIPKQFLKSIQRTGFGSAAFFQWRYDEKAEPDPSFPLNQPAYEGRSILVTGNNFGCGSSREHAVWALVQDGFRVVIAPHKQVGEQLVPGFADIFKNNTTKNGLLAIELSEADVDAILAAVESAPGTQATVDLGEQTISVHREGEAALQFGFEIDAGVKHQLYNGLDEIGLTLAHEPDITAYEAQHPELVPGHAPETAG